MRGLKLFMIVLFFIGFVFVQTGFAQQVSEYSNHSITLEQAKKLTQNFQKSMRAGEKVGGFFSKDAILKILNQPNCIGIRYYYGKQDDGTPVIVLVGVDYNGQDMTYGEMAEFALQCPPYCDSISELDNK